MSQKESVSTSLADFSDPGASKQSRATYDALKANPLYFPTPDAPLADFLAAITDFDAKSSVAYKGNRVQTAQKNEARIVLNNIYSVEGHYVNRVSNGNLEMLLASKFIMNKEKSKPEVVIFSAKNGDKPGLVKFGCHRDKLASAYQVEFRIVSDTAPNDWAFCKTLGSTEGEKDGFTSGLVYEFRMKIIYSKTESDYCESVTLRIM